MSPEELKASAFELRDAARNGARWLTDNETEMGNQDGIKKRLRKSARSLDSYANAAGKKMGIAVFGPSQVGKSTMISALAMGPRAGKLMVDFQGEYLDFLKQVNPEGGKETTGLVTRFSLESPPPSPDRELPVCLKLFSEMDIAKILANTYFAEAQGGEDLDEEALKRSLEKLEKSAGSPVNAPSLDHMEDLNEYVDGISSKYSYGKSLKTYFWPRAVELAQKLDVKERSELLSWIWGGIPQFTEVYRKLHKALQSLNFPATAFTELKALFDREAPPGTDGRDKSVLHVSMLQGILEETRDTIEVASQDGKRTPLERPVLSALIAELHVKVVESPGDFMIKADILDFPGYRARKEYKNFAEAIRDPQNLAQCFLRGKVAYVFERFAAQKEITAMLLCIRDGNVDCPGLPEVINGWIGDTHGRNQLERTGKPVCLFMVLTFFNNHLIRTAGVTDLSNVFRNRFDASIGDTFRKDGWPDHWSQEGGVPQTFKNCFWLLNVLKTEQFLLIEKQGGEAADADAAYISKGVRPEQKEWIASLKAAYLATDNVRRYIANPEEAWGGALEAPDGGTGYIISKLTPLVGQDLKTRQLTDLTLAEGEQVLNTLSTFYQGGTSEEEKTAKRKAYVKVTQALIRLGSPADAQAAQRGSPEKAPWHRFGMLLRELTLSDDDCHEIFSRPLAEPAEAEDEEADVAPEDLDQGFGEAEVDEDDIMAMFASEQPTPAQGGGAPRVISPARREDDTASLYRRLLEKEWKESLERLTADKDKRRYFGFTADDFRSFVSELDHGARRLGVMEKIESAIREAMGYANVNPASRRWKVARIASAMLSDYVCFLGLSPRHNTREERTLAFQGKVFLVFEPTHQNDGFPELPDLSPSYESPYHNDWRLSLYKVMMDNVDFAEKNYNQAENGRLGAILKLVQGQKTRLKPPSAA
ncbi:MAG: putative virulence factor [Deltaproteobacteria bacterium]|jgi:hypothetical protein|nr:putative virulence factor [Deltaproteobacteria bacterium]